MTDNTDSDETESTDRETYTDDWTYLPSHYQDPSTRTEVNSTQLIRLLRDNESDSSAYDIQPETVPYNGRLIIDFFINERPVAWFYEPMEEEPQFIIAFPTERDPNLRLIKSGHRYFDTVRENVENGAYERDASDDNNVE